MEERSSNGMVQCGIEGISNPMFLIADQEEVVLVAGWKYYSQREPSVPVLAGGLQEMPEIRHQSLSASGWWRPWLVMRTSPGTAALQSLLAFLPPLNLPLHRGQGVTAPCLGKARVQEEIVPLIAIEVSKNLYHLDPGSQVVLSNLRLPWRAVSKNRSHIIRYNYISR